MKRVEERQKSCINMDSGYHLGDQFLSGIPERLESLPRRIPVHCDGILLDQREEHVCSSISTILTHTDEQGGRRDGAYTYVRSQS